MNTFWFVVLTDWQVKPPVFDENEQTEGPVKVEASVQVHPFYCWHWEEQPSRSLVLPSSQSSPGLGSPFPHKLVGKLGLTLAVVEPT